jgi:hypothetical protein
MKGKLALLALVAMFVAAGAAAFTAASSEAAPAATTGVTLPATCTDAVTAAPAACTLQLVGFTTQNGAVAAVLRLTNTATGQVTQIVVALVPGTQQQGGTCTLLDLTIQPIDLFLLGLHLHTDTIHLVLTAQRGTLLGDLLCGLFFGNPGGAATALNQLLRQGAIGVA